LNSIDFITKDEKFHLHTSISTPGFKLEQMNYTQDVRNWIEFSCIDELLYDNQQTTSQSAMRTTFKCTQFGDQKISASAIGSND
jgi:hypothetical protein